MFLKALLVLCCSLSLLRGEEKKIYLWQSDVGNNFGDYLCKVIVERMIRRQVCVGALHEKDPLLFTIGTVLHHAREGDTIWGSGFRDDVPIEKLQFKQLDVRAVRGPLTRKFLMSLGISCPEVYGDPALLLPLLFPEFKRGEPQEEYVIIPNIGEIASFRGYKHVVLPTEPWEEIVRRILNSRLVISSSLHGLIVAESYGIPARLLRMTWIEPLIKYQDYYASTGREQFTYARSVQEALRLGGEHPGALDLQPLLDSFPYDYFQ